MAKAPSTKTKKVPKVSKKRANKNAPPLAAKAESKDSEKKPVPPAAKGGAPKGEPVKTEAPKAEPVKTEAPKAEPPKTEPVKTEAPKAALPEAPATPIPESAPPVAEASGPKIEPLLPLEAIPSDDPNSPADPPGLAPPGDSRSFRGYQDGKERFVFIYRKGPALIQRHGNVGKQGEWTSKKYPSPAAAAHAYAQECSEISSKGFYDLKG